MESDRGLMLSKLYVKFFLIAMILLATGISLVTVRALFITYADPGSAEEYEFFLNFINTIATLSMLFLQLGFVMFCFSAFWGAISDGTLSDNIRKSMIFTASIAVISLALIMIFGGLIIV